MRGLAAAAASGLFYCLSMNLGTYWPLAWIAPARGRPERTEAAREVDEALAGRGLEIGRPVLVRDLRREPLFADLELDANGHCPRSVLSYPWTQRGRPAGIIFLARSGEGRPFGEDNMEFLTLALAPVIYLLRKNGGGLPAEAIPPKPADASAAAASWAMRLRSAACGP